MNFTVYKSSAGSGKTFTLVKEYLKIALQNNKPDNYRGILAITFTNKATSEMKERIISALKALSSGKISDGRDKTLQENLLRELNADEQILCERAKNALTHILHHYSDFSISTIDKFVHKIVRTFAHDLNLPVNFNVELDEENLLNNAIDQLIANVGKNEAITKILVEFTERKADAEKSWNIEKDLLDFAKEMLKEDSAEFIESLINIDIAEFFSIKEKLLKEISLCENKLKKTGVEALSIIRNAGISENSFAGGQHGIGKYFTCLSEFDEDKIHPTDALLEKVHANKWYAGKALVSEKQIIDGIKNLLEKLFFEGISIAENYCFLQAIFKNFYALAVLRELEIMKDEIKKEKNIMHISEFNKKISEVVSKESAPFIYERLGEKYHHFLIDEFQDTSSLQWLNLLPLIHNSLSEGNFNMAVGDGKQAIYRWRSGDVEQFANLPKIKNPKKDNLLAEREQALTSNFHENVLNKNFRSQKAVVEFNNYFFEHLAAKLDPKYQSIYATQKQDCKEENTSGFVSVEVFRDDTVPDIRQKNLERTLEIIKQVRENNYELNNICILCRRKTNASELASFLLENRIDVISSESLLLSQSAEVNFLISLFGFLHSNHEKKFQSEIAIFLIEKNFIDGNLHEVLSAISRGGNKKFFYSWLKNSGYRLYFSRLKKLSLYELAEEFIRTFSICKNANPYIACFLEMVHEFSKNETENILEFLQHWENKKDSASIAIPEGVNAVQIMTIHKAKGLEFPVVIFPFANWEEKLTKNFFWIDVKNTSMAALNSAIVNVSKKLEQTPIGAQYEEEKNKTQLDNFNLLYVAFTRAKEQLYVLTSVEKGKTVSKNFIDILQKHPTSWNDEKQTLTIGTEMKNENVKEMYEPSIIKQLISADWKNKVYISSSAEKYFNEEQKNYGKLLHFALSLVYTDADINYAIQKMRIAGICNEDELNFVEKKIKKLLSNPQIKVFFENGLEVKTEAEILLENGEIYRPDRVILSEHSATIIDYKTGAEKPEHIEQVEKYAEALKKMNIRKIEKYLIYTEEEKVVEVA